MSCGKKKIKVIYSSTNEKDLKDAILALIKVHENKSFYNEPLDNRRTAI